MATRAKKTERTRAAIETALVRLLAIRAYDAVTMAEIAEQADVAVRTVQRHFGSKDEILAAAVRHPAQALSKELSQRLPGQSPYDDLRGLAASLFAIYERYRRETWALYTRSAEVPELMRVQFVAGAAMVSAVEALLARWSDRRAIDPLLAKRAILALISYPAWRGLAGVGGFGPPEAETFIAGLLHHLIFEPAQQP
jgi:AcrR family transcriptional regulator